MTSLAQVSWLPEQLPAALNVLAERAGLAADMPEITPPGMAFGAAAEFRAWLAWAAERLGVEAEEIETPGAELETVLAQAGPALVRYAAGGAWRFVLLPAPGNGGKLRALGPDLRSRKLDAALLRDALCAERERALLPELDALLQAAAIPAARRERCRKALLRERLAALPVTGIWLLRLPPETDFVQQLRHGNVLRRAFATLAVFAALYLLEMAGWWLIGKGALDGRLDMGWLSAWVLLLVTLISLRLLGGWLGGSLAIRTAVLLKRRLLAGALQMPPETIRSQGAGQLLGRVIESEAFESLALNGGIAAPIALLEVFLAAFVLYSGAGGWVHVALLGAWGLVAVWLGRRLLLALRRWTGMRLEMAHDLVEHMVGHRTRLAQQAPERWHGGEDQALTKYLQLSRDYDAAIVALNGLLPRGWLLLGILGFVPALLGGGTDPLPLAIGLGGVLLGYRAMYEIAANLANFAQAAVAWRQIAPIFRAAQPPRPPAVFHTPTPKSADGGKTAPILEGRDLLYRYRPQGTPVLAGCDVKIYAGERALLQGMSGGGKSTLAALLCGLRQPESGLLLLHGLDNSAWGVHGWRKAVAAAPQFHENYVFSAPFAFNLLLGRRWPPSDADLQEAEEVCRGLGLGELLERMPAGLMQMVGETGWRLSHGECSRTYLARALLQEAQVVVLDESFGALDSETLGQCLRFVLQRAPALMVIAHP
jgi:ATP-binding cassette subfamily B protein